MPPANAKLTAAVEEYLSDLCRVRASGGATGERSYYPALTNLLNAVGGALRPKVFCVSEMAQQGAGHPDIGLNDRAYWRNVPINVWNYKLGGYQVLKKWLSYREHRVLGRALLPEEVQHFTDVGRRIGAVLTLTEVAR